MAAPRIAHERDGHGEGVPVMLLHGVTRSSAAWRWVLPHLVGSRVVVRIDLRGMATPTAPPARTRCPGTSPTPWACSRRRWGGQRCWSASRSAGSPRRPWHSGGRPSGHGDTVAERYCDGVPLARAEAELQCDLSVLDRVIDPPPEHLGPGWDPEAGFDAPGVVLSADRHAPDRVTRRRDAERMPQVCPDLEWVEVAGAGHELQDERDHRATFVAHLGALLGRLDP